MDKPVDTENTLDSAPVTVNPVYDNGEKKKQMIKYIILAVIVVAVIVIAAVIAVKSSKNKDNTVDEVADTAEQTADEDDDTDSTTEDYTVSTDINIDFSAMSDEYAEDLADHMESTAVTVTQKATVTTASSSQSTAASSSQSTTASNASSQTQSSGSTKATESNTEKTTQPADSTSSAIDKISAFFNGVYYLDGSMVIGNEETPIEMAMSGSDIEIFTEMEGIDIAMLQLDGKTYLLNPETKKYMELSSTVKKAMGFDDDDFNFEFTNLNFDGANPSTVSKATVNGESAVCYTYIGESSIVDFYTIDDEIIQIEVADGNGTVSTVLKIDEFDASIPADMLTLKGYSKTTMLSFFSSLM